MPAVNSAGRLKPGDGSFDGRDREGQEARKLRRPECMPSFGTTRDRVLLEPVGQVTQEHGRADSAELDSISGDEGDDVRLQNVGPFRVHGVPPGPVGGQAIEIVPDHDALFQ
jgi:hypothetical protein